MSPSMAHDILCGRRDATWGEGFPAAGEIKAATWVLSSRYDPLEVAPFITYVIMVRDTGLLIGGAGFHNVPADRGIECGYGLCPAYQGFGYATEAATLLVRAAFDSGKVDHVRATTDEDNVRSKAVLKRAGFTPMNAFETEWLISSTQ